jgi:glutamyl-tRNA(Gln) amidotransferase subunit E
MVARSTGRVRTGIGASREDVNVSVRGGSRNEIKGVPRAGYAVKLVHNEGLRQYNLLKIRAELHERGLKTPDNIKMSSFDVSHLFTEVDLGFMQRTLKAGGKVYAVKIEGVAGLAQHPTQPDTNFLDELRGRVRVIACLDEPPIVLSSAQMPVFADKYAVIDRIRKRVELREKDDFFIVFGPEQDCITAAEEIRLRFCDATLGVPQETRQAVTGGFTTFERILPGPDRMYPDTDSPPTRVTKERVEEARVRLRPAPWKRIESYMSWRVPEETAFYLIRRGGADIVDAAVKQTGVDGLFAAITIGQRYKALKRAGIPIQRLGTAEWLEIFDRFTDGRIPREAVPAVAQRMAEDRLDVDAACEANGIAIENREQWHAEANSLNMDGYFRDYGDNAGKRVRFLTGKAVKMLNGKAPAAEVAAYIRETLNPEVAK